MNTALKFALLMLLLATISSTTHTIHLDKEYRLEFTNDGQLDIVKGDGEGKNRCASDRIICYQQDENWRVNSLHFCEEWFPINYFIARARIDQERQEFIELSKTEYYGRASTCRLQKEEVREVLQFLE
jgi:hypothetical protein